MKTIRLFVLLILILSCTKEPSKLQLDFNCKTNINFKNLEKIEDINNKFTLNVPKKWSTKLFFNNHESQIMTADTLKNLTKTFILETALINGNLELNNDFKTNVIQNLKTEENLFEIKNGINTFKDLPAIWFYSNGKSGTFDYHLFRLFAKKNETEYFQISTKIYGDKLVNQRLCESIALMEKIEFNN